MQANTVGKRAQESAQATQRSTQEKMHGTRDRRRSGQNARKDRSSVWLF